MGWAAVAFMVAISPLLLTGRGATANAASPVDDAACDGVECGRGSCRASAEGMFGFECECDPGWTQLGFVDHMRFLPCIIPNCTFDYACYNDSVHHAPPPLPGPTDRSLFDPCLWSYCGDGACVKTSLFGHRCECKEGFDNLLNITSLPCFKECALGADCPSLGITLSNNSSPPSPPNFSNRRPQASSAPTNSLWSCITMIFIALAQSATQVKF